MTLRNTFMVVFTLSLLSFTFFSYAQTRVKGFNEIAVAPKTFAINAFEFLQINGSGQFMKPDGYIEFPNAGVYNYSYTRWLPMIAGQTITQIDMSYGDWDSECTVTGKLMKKKYSAGNTVSPTEIDSGTSVDGGGGLITLSLNETIETDYAYWIEIGADGNYPDLGIDIHGDPIPSEGGFCRFKGAKVTFTE